MTTTIPECLARTAADDRAEAHDAATCGGWGAASQASYERDRDAALAAIQRREAEAVRSLAVALDLPMMGGYEFDVIDAAKSTARAAFFAIRGGALTLAQRATLLDAARSLVRLAIEVARG